jgi:hypothetical protein
VKSPVEELKPTDMSLPLSSHSKARDEEIDYGEERGRETEIFRCLPRSEAEHEGSWVAAYAA